MVAPVLSALRLGQEDSCKSEANLCYIVSISSACLPTQKTYLKKTKICQHLTPETEFQKMTEKKNKKSGVDNPIILLPILCCTKTG